MSIALGSDYSLPLVSSCSQFLLVSLCQVAPLETLLDSMHTIRRISAQMLAEKIRETSGITIDDMHTKKDIMSLLVRARQADLTKDGAYSMTDEAMVDQVVCFHSRCYHCSNATVTRVIAHFPRSRSRDNSEWSELGTLSELICDCVRSHPCRHFGCWRTMPKYSNDYAMKSLLSSKITRDQIIER